MDQKKKAFVFKSLHEDSEILMMPNAWDAGSARLLANLGFKALGTTSAGLAFSLGRPDGSNDISRDEILANARDIVHATGLPVSADLEGGFGRDPETCAATIKMAAAVGLVGGSIEDATGEASSPIHDFGLAVERIRAAAEAARATGWPFILTARADNYLYGRPDLRDTIKRLQAFQEAGADVLYAPGVKTKDEIDSLVRAVDRPVNIVMGLVGVDLTVGALAQLGVKRISTGGSLARAAIAAYLRGAREIRDSGTFGYAREAIPDGELSSLLEKLQDNR